MTPDFTLDDYSRSEFNARIRRIQAGTGHTKGTIFVGTDESYRDARPKYVSRKPRRQVVLGHAVALVTGLAAGILVHLARAYAGFEGDQGLKPTVGMALNFGGAMVIGWVMANLFGLHRLLHVVVLGVGAALMLVLFQDLVHWQPDLSRAAFPPGWTETVLATADANAMLTGSGFIAP